MRMAITIVLSSTIVAIGVAAAGFLAGGRYASDPVPGGIMVYDRWNGEAYACAALGHDEVDCSSVAPPAKLVRQLFAVRASEATADRATEARPQ